MNKRSKKKICFIACTVHTCHHVDLNSKIALSRMVDLKEVCVGLVLEYE